MSELRASHQDGVVTVHEGSTLLARYRASTPASKPYFEVVALPAGAGEIAGCNLVLAAPHDHVWHLGLFFCQKMIDGVNCWESEVLAQRHRLHGRAEHVDLAVESAGSPAIALVHTVKWVTSEGEELLLDRRRIAIHPPQRDAYFIVWEATLEALGNRRHLSSETIHGHYSGLSYRALRSMTGGRILLRDGEYRGSGPVPRSPWCDLSGGLDGSLVFGRPYRAGITMMYGPGHPEDEMAWFAMNQPFSFISANPTYERVLTVDVDKPVTWRWGVWVHAGMPDAAQIEAKYQEFCALVG